MESFTPDQLLILAQHWRLAAQTLNAYQTAHWADFSVEQHLDINAYQNSLLSRANDLEIGQVRAIIHDALPAYPSILQATTLAIKNVASSREQTVGLTTGAMLVALAAAVARGHLKNIEVALRQLSALWEMGER